MSAVRLVGVSKRYAETVAVRDVSFDIPPGTLVTLLGPSGCGKTTTLRMLAGLELPSEGQIFIGDRDVTRLPAHERNVAMVFQSYALFPHLRVLDNVAYGLTVQHARDASDKARRALKTVGLEGYESRWPTELSGGQQQRVALARALVLEPQVLLFDEPLSNLDARLRRRMREEIRELQQRLKLTAVYVTHDQDEALSISDRIIVMDKSVVVQQGSPRELYESPRTRFVADFMGESNVLNAVLDADGVTVRLGPLTLTLPKGAAAPGPVKLAVRPHAVRLSADGALKGRVERATYLGDHLEYEVSTDAGLLFVVCAMPAAEVSTGEAVGVTFDAARGGVAILPT
jgi:iron(III) transport system ATP-binding protein